MVSIPPELSLGVRSSYVPKTIREFFHEHALIGSVSERSLRIDEFVKQLEEEIRKIDVFKRELPLCSLLLNDAIVTLKEERVLCRTSDVQPVLEEFIPLNKSCDEVDKSEVEKEKESRDKMNWMKSVQLWNPDNSKNIGSDYDPKLNSAKHFLKESGEDCGLEYENPFPFSKNRAGSRVLKDCSVKRREENGDVAPAGLSLLTPGTKSPREEVGTNCFSSKMSAGRAVSSISPAGHSNLNAGPLQPSQQQTGRKQRRCWSPELHRRFVDALQQLGGSQAATPKQIRELMQVDGLTNDEVKSHLQKYRLHNRRLAAPANQPAVFLGDLIIPQEKNGESSKLSSSLSSSPQGPLQLAGRMEEEEDERSESHSWKTHIRKSGKMNV
ncbi:hypothetical protein NMG60_11015327 [Bertholletia excelsa]